MAAEHGLQKIWRSRSAAAWALWPLSVPYRALVALRRMLYRAGLLASAHPGPPVVVVGNVVAGGGGKTPVVMAVVRHLQSRGMRPGVISRGYGRRTADCREVFAESAPADVGDEPALIARSLAGAGTPVPVFVGRRRVEAARALLAAHPHTNVLVCDDGLQHLALRRDVEICVFSEQGIGNGFVLPAGPLREPWPRPVDLVLYAGDAPPPLPDGGATRNAFRLRRRLAEHALRSDGNLVPLVHLRGQPLHAVAAVARPDDFFAMLRAQGLALEHTEALPDHYNFDSYRRNTNKRYRLICTEKDAVKLWRRHPEALTVPLVLDIEPGFFTALDERLPG